MSIASMSSTVQVRFREGAPAGDVDRAMSALARLAWAYELYERPDARLLLVLVPINDANAAKAEVARLLEGASAEVAGAREAKVIAEWLGWREASRLIQVGPLWIAPARHPPPRGLQRVLRIETKGAFGSGLHETTLLCLERILELSPLDELLDVGTGTGILALTALALGARTAVGVDIDPESVAAARANAEANGFGAAFRGSTETADAVGRTFPFVVANIIAPVLRELAEPIASAVASQGVLLLSGLRETDIEDITTRYSRFGFTRRESSTRGAWARIELVRASKT
jgi:ribosomal protein L11 methyltransferase